MDSKIEKQIISEYKNGKSNIEIVKIVGLSKPTILKVLNTHNLIRKRDRCLSLNIKKDGDRYYVLRKCPMCKNDVKTSSKDKTIACRNHFNIINSNSLCRICMGKNNTGEGNPFYGKKHTKKTKKQISKNRKGKAIGDKNSMSNIIWRKKAKDNLKKKWDSGELDHLKPFFSDLMKKTISQKKIKSVVRSKKETEIIDQIEKMGYSTQHSYMVESKICDIYIPSLNLIIEYNGDYWHCNPKKYEANYYNQKKQKFAKELWEYDKNKVDLILKKGYNLEVVWESDLKNDHTIINKLIKKYDKK
jgi:G:T-mismatch repair DNA endonuclease (very short patch repair protein)